MIKNHIRFKKALIKQIICEAGGKEKELTGMEGKGLDHEKNGGGSSHITVDR
jgi:hypothetical protein